MTLARWTITGGGYRAEVLEAGGGLGGLWYGDEPVVARTAPPVAGGHGQVLVPWPNRIRDGRYAFAGVQQQLPMSEPELANACHGLVRWSPWRLADRGPDRLRVVCPVVPQAGYPWELDLAVEYAVSADGLSVTMSATNRSAEPAPFAAGMHPYLDVGAPVDDATLTFRAATHLRTDERHLPTGTQPATGATDFAAGRRIADTRIDDAWTDLARDDAGWASVEVAASRVVTVHLGPEWRWVQVFTGDTLAQGARQALAVEPMTAPADAFNSGVDLLTLGAGEQWSGRFRISCRAGPAAPAASRTAPR
jgi:aldose 1-epimerase